MKTVNKPENLTKFMKIRSAVLDLLHEDRHTDAKNCNSVNSLRTRIKKYSQIRLHGVVLNHNKL